ncbi:MAG: hypothetical protein AABX23_01965 [Nanoarchaeota archaeon]
MKTLFLFFIFFALSFVSSLETPHTVEIITARGSAVFPVSFFNSGESGSYTANLRDNSPAVKLETAFVEVAQEEFGSFNLIVDNGALEKGVYFDTLIISKESEIVQNIPVVIGLESRSSEMVYDVSIDFDANSDISVISGETILSPIIDVYKLNYNNPGSNGIALAFSIYSLEGDLLSYSEEVVSVSRQASFEHFFNLGTNGHDEVLMVASAKSGNSFGLDLYQISLSNNLLLSPPETNKYSFRIYMSIFIFLLSFIMLISYLWYNRSVRQTKNWRSEIEYIKKTQFSDAAKGLRKLEAQKDVLHRAYSSRYISKNSFDSAISEIDKLSNQLKKRL